MKNKISSFYPTLKQSWIMFVIFVIAGSIFAAAICLPLQSLFPNQELISKFLMYVLSFAPTFLYIYLKSRRVETPSIEVNESFSPIKNKFFLYIILALSTLSISVVLEPLMSLFPTPEWFNKLMEQTIGGNIYISILTVAVAAPILEELLCRGTILRGLLKHTSPVKAILWSSFIFAALHLNPWQGIFSFILGCFIGWIYYRTRSIWAGIFIHTVNNLTITLITHFSPEVSVTTSFKDLIGNTNQYMLIFAMCAAILALSLAYLIRYVNTNIQKDEPTR